MCEAASNADGYHFEKIHLHKKEHNAKGQKSTGKRIKNAERIGKQKAGEKNAKEGNQKGIPRTVKVEKDDDNHIGQPQFHARNTEVERDKGLHVGENQGERQENPKRSQMNMRILRMVGSVLFHFHCVITSISCCESE